MGLYAWDESYSVGSVVLDHRHRTLFELIGRFHGHYARGQAMEQLRPVLDGVLEIVETHFPEEENRLRRRGYPDFDRHRQDHQAFADGVRGYDFIFRDNPEDFNYVEFIGFLSLWLHNHILVEDRRARAYLADT